MTVAVGPVQITVNIVRTPSTAPAVPTHAERIHRRNAFTRTLESSRVRWMSEINRWG
jgi:hypothetical protein